MGKKTLLSNILLPGAILLGGLLIAFFLVRGRGVPEREAQVAQGGLVELHTAQAGEYQVAVTSTGVVQPQEEIEIVPQVSGRVVFADPRFVAGGFFRQGELLFALEEEEYILAVERARAGVAQAELAFATAGSRAAVAREEWEKLASPGRKADPLVLHEPQLAEAAAVLAAARAGLRQAELDQERTRLFAPFNCRVRSESVALGQYVKSGTAYGVIAGTDAAEIVVPLPLADMAWLTVPAAGSGQPGSPAEVLLEVGGATHRWSGRVVRSLGEVDAQGRMARIVVRVAAPHAREAGQPARPALVANMFVQVRLQGPGLSGVHLLPRSALREENTLWLMDQEQRLAIRPVSVLRLDKEQVLIGRGLADGEQVVLTHLAGAAAGLRLRPVSGGRPQ
jgi:RND family efflux transporter MFP subunit